MSAMTSQITSISIVYSNVRSGVDQRNIKAGLCEGNSPVTGEFPSQRASSEENVSIWWRHHDIRCKRLQQQRPIFHSLFKARFDPNNMDLCPHWLYLQLIHSRVNPKIFRSNQINTEPVNSMTHCVITPCLYASPGAPLTDMDWL